MTATPARTVQLVTELWFPAMPAINAADSQTVARTPLSDTSCMPEEYTLSLNGAVPKCTRRPRRWAVPPQAILLLAVAGRARVHALRRVCTSAQTVGLWKCKDRDTPRKDLIRREPYVVHRQRDHRVGRGRQPPQNAGARWREHQRSRLDERAMARRTSRVARSVRRSNRAISSRPGLGMGP